MLPCPPGKGTAPVLNPPFPPLLRLHAGKPLESTRERFMGVELVLKGDVNDLFVGLLQFPGRLCQTPAHQVIIWRVVYISVKKSTEMVQGIGGRFSRIRDFNIFR